MGQEALARPIENTIAGTFLVAGGVNLTIDVGVYASIATLIRQIQKVGIAAGKILTVKINSDNFVEFTMDGPQTLALHSHFARLGFRTFVFGAATTHTADRVSPYLWLPTSQSNNIDGWHQRKNYFAGGPAANGADSGFDLGPIIWEKTLEFHYEPIANIYEESGTDAAPVMSEGITLEQLGMYMPFMRYAKVKQTSSADSNNISAKGFYYLPDIATTAAVFRDGLDTMDSGGVFYDLDSGNHTYTFCRYNGEQIERSVNAFGRSRIRYHCRVPVHTVTAPTWLVTGVS